jgi:hypothetical protein
VTAGKDERQMTTHATGTWFLAPSTDRTDEHAAGYDGNAFATREEAIAAIPGLQACGEDFGETTWVAVQRSVHCECGEAMGERCNWTGQSDETVVIDWMPEHLRESHRAAGNSGSYPHNGALRLQVHRDCAQNLLRHDGEWTTMLSSEEV